MNRFVMLGSHDAFARIAISPDLLEPAKGEGDLGVDMNRNIAGITPRVLCPAKDALERKDGSDLAAVPALVSSFHCSWMVAPSHRGKTMRTALNAATADAHVSHW